MTVNANYQEALRRITEIKAKGENWLSLSGLDLAKLPKKLRELRQLKILNISANRLAELPEWLAELSQLQVIFVSDNQLAKLPDSLCCLSLLEHIDVSRNQLNVLPENLGQLTRLTGLNCENNRLAVLPNSLGRLVNLLWLDVSNNQLCSLPDRLGQLSQLRGLDAAHNDLAALPSELKQLPLQELWLQGNPRLGLGRALLGNYIEPHQRGGSDYHPASPAAILAAYFGAQEKDGRALNEIKLVLVGRGAAGKTSIARRLVKNTFSSRQKETPGIDICRWKLFCGETEVTVNLWDFAGQVITHATHQFFLSCDSVYVLVLTGREDTQKSDADYWLRLIRAFAGDVDGHTAPVIVALNKWEQHPFKLDRNLLQEKYPFIAGFIETDCKSGLGMEALKERLAELVQGMDIVRRPFKLSWWQIKQHLEQAQRKKHYLPYSEFQAICAEFGEADAGQQRILAEVFHALGIALNYGQDERLRHSTVLNPRWVTEGIYTLLRQAVAEDGSAEMTLARVFISYASSDARFKDQLLVRLKPMQTSTGLIECWHDRLIGPGEDWDGEIKAELERADVILLLVSAQFRNSDYIRSVEMRRAMERHEAGQARVIPIVLEACDWQREVFGKCEALPGKAKPVRDWKPQDKGWYDVEMALSKVFADLRRQRENSPRDGLVYLREKLS